MPSIDHGMNHYTFSRDMNHYVHFYGSTAIDANRTRWVVNLMLKEGGARSGSPQFESEQVDVLSHQKPDALWFYLQYIINGKSQE